MSSCCTTDGSCHTGGEDPSTDNQAEAQATGRAAATEGSPGSEPSELDDLIARTVDDAGRGFVSRT